MGHVIFDLNRTIYDPDTDTPLPYAEVLLGSLKELGWRQSLVSRNEPGRGDILQRFGLARFFDAVVLVPQKNQALFEELVGSSRTLGETFVIGDYLHEEIRFGNQCGSLTVWLRRGKFANLTVEVPADVPWRTVASLEEVMPLIMTASQASRRLR